MAILLENSMFIHIPKCGGRWATQMIISNCQNYSFSGDRVYDAHDTPDSGGKKVFAFVREPASFCHSLWHHRARKKSNTRGNKFNWQEYINLENVCQSSNYLEFMENCSKLKNGVVEYYNYYLKKYEGNLIIGKVENIAFDLVNILTQLNEKFSKDKILANTNNIIGKGSDGKIDPELRYKINAANLKFSKKFKYIN